MIIEPQNIRIKNFPDMGVLCEARTNKEKFITLLEEVYLSQNSINIYKLKRNSKFLIQDWFLSCFNAIKKPIYKGLPKKHFYACLLMTDIVFDYYDYIRDVEKKDPEVVIKTSDILNREGITTDFEKWYATYEKRKKA